MRWRIESPRSILPLTSYSTYLNACTTDLPASSLCSALRVLHAWSKSHHCYAQELADQVRSLEDASEGAEPDSDLATLHVALREIVDACDNKAAQLYALQQL